VYARNQEFTELHNSPVTELAFGQRSHGGYQVLTQQGGRLMVVQERRHRHVPDRHPPRRVR
jgi:hypothetical protein